MTVSFRERCRALRQQGKRIIEIVKITDRAKSSVYTHIRDMPLSADRMRAVRVASGRHIRLYALARKGKSARKFRTFKKWTPELVLLVAHLLFDGEIYRGGIYNNRNTALIERVEQYMRILYDYEPKRYTNPLTGVHRISYHNVEFGAFLKAKSRELLTKVKRMPPELKREFLRAFFDDEGCMDYRPNENRRMVRGYQKDVRILKLVKTLLQDFRISARIVRPNEVVIVGKENLKRFQCEINFSRGIFMNGDRPNSRWKKHMEKRELLRLAIASFKN